jgi:hypothetical protein
MMSKWSLALLFTVFASVSAIAEPSALEARRDAQHRINIAGRQRMLSQRIAKAACLTALHPGGGDHFQEMHEAYALFKSSMRALINGSAEIGLAAERDTEVLSAIQMANRLAVQYGAAIDELMAAYPAGPVQARLAKFNELNLPVLIAINDAVELLESKHEDGHLIRPGLANAINISGRQRMLSQKMSKELCMIASGFKAQETRAHMLGTVALFTSSLEELKMKLAAMQIAQKEEVGIRVQLAKIERHWQELAPIFQRVSEGATPSDAEVKIVAAANKSLLVELNQAVELYERVDVSD